MAMGDEEESASLPSSRGARDDGHLYIQVEIGFHDMQSLPWYISSYSQRQFCLEPHPHNLGNAVTFQGPHRNCEAYSCSRKPAWGEKFVLYSSNYLRDGGGDGSGQLKSFMVLTPMLKNCHWLAVLIGLVLAIHDAFPNAARRLKYYDELNLSIGIDPSSKRVFSFRQLRRIGMALVLFGDEMVACGAFKFVLTPTTTTTTTTTRNTTATTATTTEDCGASREEKRRLIGVLDGMYDIGQLLAFFAAGGEGAGLPVARYWQLRGCLGSKGSIDLVHHVGSLDDNAIRWAIERSIMFVVTATRTQAEQYLTWARDGIVDSRVYKRFGCAVYDCEGDSSDQEE